MEETETTNSDYNFLQIFGKYQRFESCSRERGQDLNEFLSLWHEKMLAANSAGCQYSDNLLACKLLEKVNIHQEDLSEVLSSTTEVYSESDIYQFIVSKLESTPWRDKEEDGKRKSTPDLVLSEIKEENLQDSANCYIELDNLLKEVVTTTPDLDFENEDTSLSGKRKPKEKYHRCELCGKLLNRPWKLRNHYKSKHRITKLDKIESEDAWELPTDMDLKDTDEEKLIIKNGTLLKDNDEEEDIDGLDFDLDESSPKKKKRSQQVKFHQCKICSKWFNRPGRLKAHYKEGHSLTDIDMDADNHPTISVVGNKTVGVKLATASDKAGEQPNVEDLDSSTDQSTYKKEKKNQQVKFHQCKICRKWFKRPGRLKEHYKLGHGKTDIDPRDGNHATICIMGNKAPKAKPLPKPETDANSHDEDIPDESKYHQCEFCGEWIKRIGKLKEHYRLHHGGVDGEDKSQEKPEDSASEGTPVSVRKQRKYIPKVHHECKICQVRFQKAAALKEHQTDLHSDVLSAQEISDLYDQNKTIEDRKVTHECNICGKKFLILDSLKSHMQLHSGVKKYKCDQCDASFYQNGSLRYHKLKHTGVRNYKCDQCTNDYYTLGNLQCHVRRDHLNERPFKCEYCDYAALRKYDLKRHMFSHVSERPVKCDICEKAFKDNVSLKVHLRKIHSSMPSYRV